jgi:hypothetical protein
VRAHLQDYHEEAECDTRYRVSWPRLKTNRLGLPPDAPVWPEQTGQLQPEERHAVRVDGGDQGADSREAAESGADCWGCGHGLKAVSQFLESSEVFSKSTVYIHVQAT